MNDICTDGTERSDLPGVSFEDLDESSECPECEVVLDVSMNQGIIETDDDYRVLELMYVCPNCGFDWHERPGTSNTGTEHDDDLVTDGGDERPPFVDPLAEVATCYFCSQTWEPNAVDGFDLSSEDEYYPKMVPVCPEHAGGCR